MAHGDHIGVTPSPGVLFNGVVADRRRRGVLRSLSTFLTGVAESQTAVLRGAVARSEFCTFA